MGDGATARAVITFDASGVQGGEYQQTLFAVADGITSMTPTFVVRGLVNVT